MQIGSVNNKVYPNAKFTTAQITTASARMGSESFFNFQEIVGDEEYFFVKWNAIFLFRLFVCLFFYFAKVKEKSKSCLTHTLLTVSMHSYVLIVYLVYFASILLKKWICCKVSLFLFTATLVHRKHNLMFLILVPDKKLQPVFKDFSRTNYQEWNFTDGTWMCIPSLS